MVEVRAARQIQLSKELWKSIKLLEGINQQCLLPVGQELQIDAQSFFYYFIGLLQEVALELQMPDVTLQRKRCGGGIWRLIGKP
jgi:hypothetical protein